jgi:hypothetical protein
MRKGNTLVISFAILFTAANVLMQKEDVIPGRGTQSSNLEILFVVFFVLIRALTSFFYADLFFVTIPLYLFILKYKYRIRLSISFLIMQLVVLFGSVNFQYHRYLKESHSSVLKVPKSRTWIRRLNTMIDETEYTTYNVASFGMYLINLPRAYYKRPEASCGAAYSEPVIYTNGEIRKYSPDFNIKLLICFSAFLIFAIYYRNNWSGVFTFPETYDSSERSIDENTEAD